MRRFPLLSHAGDDPNTIAEMIRVRAGAKAPRTADGKPDPRAIVTGRPHRYRTIPGQTRADVVAGDDSGRFRGW